MFDLDNTLYPPDSDLWPQIDARITGFLMDFLGLDGLAARALQKHYYKTHGTTLKGLMTERRLDPAEFLAVVHDIDRSNLAAAPALDHSIRALPGKKYIFTNGSTGHAEATARQLGILDNFSGIFDIAAAGYVPKPLPEAYQLFFTRFGIVPGRAAMFEDLVKNLAVPHAAGMTTVLVAAKASVEDNRDAWEKQQTADPTVDFVTDDLAGFLAANNPSRGQVI